MRDLNPRPPPCEGQNAVYRRPTSSKYMRLTWTNVDRSPSSSTPVRTRARDGRGMNVARLFLPVHGWLKKSDLVPRITRVLFASGPDEHESSTRIRVGSAEGRGQ